MSLHNKLEQYPQLLKGFNVATGLLENEEGVIRLGETLTPTIDLFNGRREWALLRGEQWYARRTFIAAGGAGTNAAIGLGNPANSGFAACLVAASVTPAAGNQACSLYAYSYATAAAQWGAAAAKGIPMDRRRQTLVAGSICDILNGNTPVGIPAGGFDLDYRLKAALDTIDFVALPQMLYAGDAIMVVANTVVTAINVNLVWYERKCVVNEARGG